MQAHSVTDKLLEINTIIKAIDSNKTLKREQTEIHGKQNPIYLRTKTKARQLSKIPL